MTIGWLGYRLVTQSIREYLKEGFEISSAIAPDTGADLIATRGSTTVLIQVKTYERSSGTPQPAPQSRKLASGYSGRDIRFDVVWYPVLRLVSRDDVIRRVREVRDLAEGHAEAAFLLAYATLEAATLRVVSSCSGELIPPFTMTTMATRLREDGLASEREFDQIIRASKIRNSVAHGAFGNQLLQRTDVEDVAHLAEFLNNSIASLAVGVLDGLLLAMPSSIHGGTHDKLLDLLRHQFSSSSESEEIRTAIRILQDTIL